MQRVVDIFLIFSQMGMQANALFTRHDRSIAHQPR